MPSVRDIKGLYTPLIYASHKNDYMSCKILIEFMLEKGDFKSSFVEKNSLKSERLK